MSRIAKLGKSSAVYGVGNILSRFLGLLLLPLFTAYLTPGDYGVLALLGLLSTVAQSVFALGMNAAMGPGYFDARDADAKSKMVWTAFAVLAVSSSLLLLAGWLFPGPLGLIAAQSSENPLLVSLTATGCALSILSTPFSQRLQFDERAKTFVAVTLVSSLATVGLSVLFVVFLRAGAQGMVLAQTLGYAANLALFMVAGARGGRIAVSGTLARQLLRLGLPLVPSFGFQFALLQGNRYFLKAISGVEAVGVYSIGFNLGTVMNIAIGALSAAWYPYFMTFLDKQEEARKLFGRIFGYYALAFGMVCVAFFAFARPVVTLMTQPDFHESYRVVGLTASAYFFVGAFNMFLPALYYARAIKHVSWIQGVAVAASLVVNFVLIRGFGMMGAAVALCISHFLMAAFLQAFNWSRRGEFFTAEYPWGSVFGALSGFAVLAGISFAGPSGVGAGSLYGAALVIAAAAWAWFFLESEARAALVYKMIKSRIATGLRKGSRGRSPF